MNSRIASERPEGLRNEPFAGPSRPLPPASAHWLPMRSKPMRPIRNRDGHIFVKSVRTKRIGLNSCRHFAPPWEVRRPNTGLTQSTMTTRT